MQLVNFKLAFRNAKKNGTLTFAKLFGICLSFTVVLFAVGYVYFEMSFDRFIPEGDRIYRCLMVGKLNSRDADFAVTSPAMAKAVKDQVPEIEESVRIKNWGEASIRYNEMLIEAGDLLVADSNFFAFFGFPIKKIRPNPFETSTDITISKNLAIKHFGSVEEALDKVVELRGDKCVITGVFDDFPKNCHLQYQVIRSIECTHPERIGWGSQSYYTYVKTFSDNIKPDDLGFKITKTVFSNSGVTEVDVENAKTWDDLKYSNSTYMFYPVEALKDVHFSQHRFNLAATANKTYVYGAIVLAILVLFISSFNYVNLTVANLSTRFKEIGIRKTNGAFSRQLAQQFLVETLVFWFVGFVCAVLIYLYIGKPLAGYLNLDYHLSTPLLVKLVMLSLAVLLLFTLLTNVIPISYVSNKKVLKLVKQENVGGKHFSLQDGFVFVQFVLSALIILSSIFVNKQINFMVKEDRGYDTENVLMLSLWNLSPDDRETFMEELRGYGAVSSVAASNAYFGTDPSMTSAHFETNETSNYFHTSHINACPEFIHTFRFNMLEGRFFDKERPTDKDAIIVNKAVADEYPGAGSLLGKNILLGNRALKVIGITENFNYRSLHHEIAPLIIRYTGNSGNIFVKTTHGQIHEVISVLKEQWEKFNITQPFSYDFHDEVLARHYESDQQARKMLLVLSIISILIACVGLYAISFFTILKKTKEFAVRKINGATIPSIASNISERFFALVIAAFLLAIPMCVVFMNTWLQNFAYKTTLDWWVFILAILITISMSVVSIIWHVYRASTRNPVEALRYE